MLNGQNDTNLLLVGELRVSELRVGKMRVGEISLNPMNAATCEAQVHCRLDSSMTRITTASPAIGTIPESISVTQRLHLASRLYLIIISSPPHQVATSNATAYDPHFVWGNFSSSEMLAFINKAYDKIVHWRQNLFPVPTGTTGVPLCRD